MRHDIHDNGVVVNQRIALEWDEQCKIQTGYNSGPDTVVHLFAISQHWSAAW
jgi:hypothetical protein